MESNHHSARRRGYSAVSSPDAQRPRRGRPTGFEPVPRAHSELSNRYRGITTSDAAVTPRPPRQRGRPGSNRRPSRLTSERSTRLSYAPVDTQWRGWDSNPRSRAHEAREDSLSSTARRCERRSGRQESNLRSPTPEAGGVACSPTASRSSTPGGTRTRSFRVEGPASSPFDHGGRWCMRAPAAGIEPAISRVTTARLANSTTPERRGKERESNPQGREAHPFSRRDTAPVAVLPDE